MNNLERMHFILSARPSALFTMEHFLHEVVVDVHYKSQWFRASGKTEEEAARTVLEKIEAGPGLVDAEATFNPDPAPTGVLPSFQFPLKDVFPANLWETAVELAAQPETD